jgi:UDP-N-acetylmuramoyl-tripeptide--D-alanyl-D-alanine ligase
MLTLSMAAEAMQGTLTGADAPFMGVASDSRHIKAHDLFFALEGARHDGHQFAKEALQRGAAGIVAHKKLGLGEILVNDTKKALLALAAFWRNHFAIPVVAVTGSCGKTSVTEMIAHLLPG